MNNFDNTSKEINNRRNAVMNNIAKSFEPDIEKGGEGSRGGKIIGHTKSGKPIYQQSNKGTSKNYTTQDHKDARDLHYSLYNKHARINMGNEKYSKGDKKYQEHPDFKKEHPDYDDEKRTDHLSSFAYHRDMSERREKADKKKQEKDNSDDVDYHYDQMSKLQKTKEYKKYLKANGYDEDEVNPEDWEQDAEYESEGDILHKLLHHYKVVSKDKEESED